MPISDEIIELAPVKKTKSKLIIMFAIMGVLLAAAVTFLVLFLLNPAPTEDYGSVLDVDISSSSELFSQTDEDGNKSLTASVGNKYTVYATIGIEGEVSPDMLWLTQIDGRQVDAITIIKSGRVGENAPATLADGDKPAQAPEYVYFCTFMPNEGYANQKISLIARSMSDAACYAQVDFTIVKQGTEIVSITDYARGASGAKIKVGGNNLSLPYYANDNELYYIFFDQLGAYDISTRTYSKITKSDNSDTDAVEVVASNDVVDIVTVSNDRFTFRVKKAGEAIITINANVKNNYGNKSVNAKLTVTAVSNAALRYIEKIYFSPEPIDAEFFKAKYNNEKNKSDPNNGKENRVVLDEGKQPLGMTNVFTLPYGKHAYDNILAHIVISPSTVQYNAETGEMRTDWYDHIKVESTDKTKCDISDMPMQGIKRWSLACKTGLAYDTDCILTFSDNTKTSIGAKQTVKLNIVAASKTAVKLEFVSSQGTRKEETNLNRVATAQGNTYNMAITYNIDAPADAIPANEDKTVPFIENGMLSNKYKIELSDPNFMTVMLGNKEITPGLEYSLDDASLAAKHKANTSFEGVVNFTLNITGAGLKDGSYTITFTKLGIDVMPALDPTENIVIKFNLSGVATKAMFIDEEEAKNIITAGGKRAGSFKIGSNKTSASLYIQNQTAGKFDSLFGFDSLFDNDLHDPEKFKIVGRVQRAEPVPFKNNNNSPSDLEFKGAAPTNQAAVQAELSFTITAEGNNANLGTFTIEVYLVNEIAGISCDNSIGNKSYTGKKYEDISIDTITPSYKFNVTAAPLPTTSYSIDIEYLKGNDWITLVKQTEGTTTHYYLEEGGVQLFEYNAQTGSSILQKADFFIVGYENEHPLDDFRVVYRMAARSTADGENFDQPALECVRRYHYTRTVDDARLYTDYERNTPIEYDAASDSFTFARNQGTKYCRIFSSAIIYHNSDPTDSKPIVVDQPRNFSVSDTTAVHFTKPDRVEADNVSNTVPADGVDGAYKSIQFTMPNVLDQTNTKETLRCGTNEFCTLRYGNGTNEIHRLIVNILNNARPIDSVHWYYDEACTKPIDIIDFGQYKAEEDEQLYVDKIYLKITYKKKDPSKYIAFEALTLVLPSYLEYCETESGEYSGDKNRIEIERSSDDIESEENNYLTSFYLRLKPDRAGSLPSEASANRVTIENVNADELLVASVNVDTGLKAVEYSLPKKGGGTDGHSTDDDDYEDAVYEVKFDLNNITDDAQGKEYKVLFDPVALSSTGDYSNISYNKERLNIAFSANIPGLKFASSTQNGWFSIAVDENDVRAMIDARVVVTFNDNNAEGAVNPGNSFELRFDVTVNVAVYEVNIYPIATITTTGASAGTQTQAVTISYNNANARPVDIEDVDVKVVQYVKDGNDVYNYVKYNNTDVKIDLKDGNTDKTEYVLTVANSVATSLTRPGISSEPGNVHKLYLRVTYKNAGETHEELEPIIIITDAHAIRLAPGAIEVTTANDVKSAKITVSTDSDKFALPVEAYNLGTLSKAEKSGITYKLYSDAGRAEENEIDSNYASVVNGCIQIKDPANLPGYTGDDGVNVKNKGTLYYRASYEDTSSGVTHNIDIDVNYQISGFAQFNSLVRGADNNRYVILYYSDKDNYTFIPDVKKFFEVKTNFAGVEPLSYSINVISADPSVVLVEPQHQVAGDKHGVFRITPRGLSNAGVELTIQIEGTTKVIDGHLFVKVYGISESMQLKEGENTVTGKTVDIVAGDTASFTAVLDTDSISRNGLLTKYEVSSTEEDKELFLYTTDVETTPITSESAAVESTDGNIEISLDRTKFTGSSQYGNHNITVTGRYYIDTAVITGIAGLTSGSRWTDVYSVHSSDNETLPFVETYKLNVVGNYPVTGGAPSFDIKHDTAVLAASQTHDIASAGTYTIALNEPRGEFTYEVEYSNDIIRVSGASERKKAFTKNTITYTFDPVSFTFTTNMSGTFTLTVRATAYGKTYAAEKQYTFTYGGHATAGVGVSADNGANFTALLAQSKDAANETKNIDFGDFVGDVTTVPYVFRYTINAANVGTTVNADDVDIHWTSTTANAVTVETDKTKDGNTFYVDLTVTKATVLKITATIRVNGRTYVLGDKTLTLTATEPDFELSENNGKTQLVPTSTTGGTYETATYNISLKTGAAGFTGFTPAYSIISGGSYAKIDSTTGELTVEKPITLTSDIKVIVCATVTVDSGAFAGNTYKYYEEITVKGVALPTIEWNNSELFATDDGTSNKSTVNLFGTYTFNPNVTGYTYGAPTYRYELTAPGMASSDYSFNTTTQKLEINYSDNGYTNAGGRFEVRVFAKINDLINNEVEVQSGILSVIVKPRAKLNTSTAADGTTIKGLSISGAPGDYDISSAVELNTGSGEGQVKVGDEYAVSFTLVGSYANISVVNGNVIRIVGGVTSATTLTLNARVTIISGSYAGHVLAQKQVTVKVNGFTGNVVSNVQWDSATNVNKYPDVSIASLVPSAVAYIDGGDTVAIRSFDITGAVGAFVHASYDPATVQYSNAKLSFDKDINVVSSGATAKAVPYTMVIEVTKAGGGTYTYYGSGSISVDPITPTVRASVNGITVAADGTLDMSSHSTVNMEFEETHGLDIAINPNGFTNFGTSVTPSASGSNVMLSSVETSVLVNVENATIAYSVCGYQYALMFNISITPRASADAYTITNRNVTVVALNESGFNSYGESTVGNFRTEWIASPDNTSRYGTGVKLYLKNINGRMDTANSYFAGYRKEADGSWTQIKLATLTKRQNSSTESLNATVNWDNITFNLDGSQAYDAIVFNFRMCPLWGTSYVMTVTYNAKNSENKTVTSETDYTINFVKNTPANYNVTFDANGGTWNDSGRISTVKTVGQKYENASSVYKLPSEPTRDGYTFAGWWTEAIGCNYQVTNTQTLTGGNYPKCSHTVYARWNAQPYTVTLNADNASEGISGTTVTPSAIKVTFGMTMRDAVDADNTDMRVGLPTPTVTGYTFRYWTINSTDVGLNGSVVTEDTTITPGFYNASLQAHWTAKTMTITLDATGGIVSGNILSLPGTYGETYPVPATIPVKTGYTFAGWYTGANGTGTMVVSPNGTLNGSDGTVAIESDHYLYAHWTANTYTVTLDPDGGSFGIGVSNTVDATYGEKYPTISKKPTKTGYTFAGWYTGANGSGTMITNASGVNTGNVTVTTAAAHTLYAKWTSDTFDLAFNAGTDGSVNGTTTGKTATVGGRYTDISGISATRTGYNFAGWYTAAAGGTLVTENTLVGAADDVDGTVTLYAHWTANTYTVTLALDGGSFAAGIANTVTVTYDEKYPAISQMPTKTGYTFAGWYLGDTQITDNTGVVVNNKKVTTAAAHTLTAHWTPKELALVFDKGDGDSVTGDVTGKKVTVGGNYSAIDGIGATRTGYTFAGWYLGDTHITTASAVVATDAATQTLTAHWTARTVVVTYTVDDMTNTINLSYDAKYSSIPQPAEKTGYTFAGWQYDTSTVYDYDTPINTGFGVVISGADHTLAVTAVFDAKHYTVMLNANGGKMTASSAVASISATFGNTYTGLYNPVTAPTGYTFKGWYTDPVSETEKVESTTSVKAQDITLYAHWSTESYEIVYNLAGGTNNADNPSTYTIKDAIVLKAPTKANYDFAGWSPDGVIAAGSTGKKTFTATWTPTVYTITYVLNGGTNADANPATYTIESAEITLVDPTKAHYNFAGWTEGSEIVAGSSGNKTFTATWTPHAYTITYELNGGTNAGDNPATYTIESTKITLAAPTKANYAFAGWSDGGVIAAGSTGNKTFTAAWTPIEYTITYVLDGGTNNASNPATYNVESSVTLLAPTKVGYDFAGWSPDGGVIATGSTGEKTFTASWTAKSFTVTLNTAGASGATVGSAINVKVGDPFGTLPTITKDGYTGSWTYGGNVIGASTIVPAADAIELVAVLTPVEYDITYELGGGVNNASNPATYNIESAEIVLADPTREGYTFAGWSNSGKITAGSKGEKTFTASWTANYHTVTVNQNFTGGITYTTTVAHGGTAGILALEPTYTGYTFNGWWTHDGSGDPETQITVTTAINEDITVYAKWTPTMVITFNKGDGATWADGDETGARTVINSKIASFPVVQKENFLFAGWYANAEYTGDKATLDDTYAAETTLYAKWIAKPSETVSVTSERTNTSRPNVYLVGEFNGSESQKDYGYQLSFSEDKDGYAQFVATVSLAAGDKVYIYVPEWSLECSRLEDGCNVTGKFNTVTEEGKTYITTVAEAGTYTFYFKAQSEQDRIYLAWSAA